MKRYKARFRLFIHGGLNEPTPLRMCRLEMWDVPWGWWENWYCKPKCLRFAFAFGVRFQIMFFFGHAPDCGWCKTRAHLAAKAAK